MLTENKKKIAGEPIKKTRKVENPEFQWIPGLFWGK